MNRNIIKLLSRVWLVPVVVLCIFVMLGAVSVSAEDQSEGGASTMDGITPLDTIQPIEPVDDYDILITDTPGVITNTQRTLSTEFRRYGVSGRIEMIDEKNRRIIIDDSTYYASPNLDLGEYETGMTAYFEFDESGMLIPESGD